ncbi:uncharacterized protein C2845_PM16G00440 [Panicum miliaceum]|uniref:Reverse transcriptase zinc-binding domain-containing protein n=1 Tax=Panicum miliaceum TaxID=4540 RepID=A0A3L6PVT3_PANMI|nr:uncharacterized protein C2845_PM16G00440 [Panicum miliaceum]
MTPEAQQERTQVEELLAAWTSSTTSDKRLCIFAADDGKLHTSALYKLLQSAKGDKSPQASFTWRNKAPPRVQFFAWLLVRERIQSRAHLRQRKVLDNATCEVCSEADETAAHIIFECPFAASFWSALNIAMSRETTTAQLCELAPAPHEPLIYYSTFLLLCCWQLWKRRNNAIFRSQQEPLQMVLRAAREDA